MDSHGRSTTRSAGPGLSDIAGLAHLRHDEVAFAAPAAPAEGPLTWPQRFMLDLVEALAPDNAGLNLRFFLPLRPDVTMPEVFAALRDLLVRHHAMRSWYEHGADGPVQRVMWEGVLPVTVADIVAADDIPVAVAVMNRLVGEPFGAGAELPLRVAVLRSDGRPRHLVFAISHMFVDLEGYRWVRHHFNDLLAEPADVAVPRAEPYPPLAHAAWESSPAGRRFADHTLRHHERVYRSMPQTMVPRIEVPTERPRYRYLEYTSRAAALAAPILAQRHRVSTTVVLYAALNAVVSFVHRLPRAYLQLTMANRIDRRVRQAIGNYSEDSPSCLDVEGADLAELIVRAGPVVLGASRWGWYPPDEVAGLRRRVELDRGIAIDASCWLNHRTVRRWPEPSATAGELGAALGAASARWPAGDDSSTSTYFVDVDDTADAMRFTVLIDAWLIPPDEALAWMTGLERLLCAAVSTEVPLDALDRHTGLVARDYGPGWHRTGAGWVDLTATADLLAAQAGGPVGLGLEAGALTAYVDARAAPDPARLHAAVVGALPGRRTVAAPDRYVACEGSALPGRLDHWRSLPVVCAGTGRPDRMEAL